MTVVEHRTTDNPYDHEPTALEVRMDVEQAASLGRVTSWRIISVGDTTSEYRWAVRIHYDRKVTDA